MSLTNRYERHSLSFLDIDAGVFEDIEIDLFHLSIESYYRLLIAEILTDIDCCVYLDCDIIVQDDLNSLYSADIGVSYVAGVKSALNFFPLTSVKRKIKYLNIPSIEQYINCGVLVMNLAQVRKDGITKKFIAASKRNMPDDDQGVINSVCYGRIRHLPLRYNVIPRFIDRYSFVRARSEKVYSAAELEEAEVHPVIIHYAGCDKPWYDETLMWADIWHRYKKMTPYADIVYKPKRSVKITKFTHDETVEKLNTFSELKDKRIVLWGAGTYGAFFARCFGEIGVRFEMTDRDERKIGAEIIPGVKVKPWGELKDTAEIVIVSALGIADQVRKDNNITQPMYDLPESILEGELLCV